MYSAMHWFMATKDTVFWKASGKGCLEESLSLCTYLWLGQGKKKAIAAKAGGNDFHHDHHDHWSWSWLVHSEKVCILDSNSISISQYFLYSCAARLASSSTSLFSRAIFPTPWSIMRTPHSRIAGRIRCHRCGWYISPPLSKRPLNNRLACRIWCPESHLCL